MQFIINVVLTLALIFFSTAIAIHVLNLIVNYGEGTWWGFPSFLTFALAWMVGSIVLGVLLWNRR